jgi:hypothetical protein
MINAQKAKSTSMVMYIPSPPLGMKLRERLQNMKRYFPDEFHKESNRTVWPPFRVVGSPYLSYHFLQRLSRPIKKIRHRALTHQTLCRIAFPGGKRNTHPFYFTTLSKACQSLFKKLVLEITFLYYMHKPHPRISTFRHAKTSKTVLQ